jgi:hypothetical protein
MTRKDYVRLATAMRDTRIAESGIGGDSTTTWRLLLRNVSDALLADNSRFKRDRFEAACYADPKTAGNGDAQ